MNELTTYWAPLLHIYQPPTQDIEVLRTIDTECYKPLFSMMDEHENAKFCLNINGILIDLLHDFGLGDTVEQLKNLVAECKLEILGTGKFHPILPLIPKKEALHQIRINEELNIKVFGDSWQKNGFFPPEMAISPKVARYIKELGYKWVIMSGIACPDEWAYDKIYESPEGLQLIFRDDVLSNKISFKKIKVKEFVKELKTMYKNGEDNDTYIITAMDGETFGHHIKNYERTFLGKALKLIADDDSIEVISISELDQHFAIAEDKIVPRESSWSTEYDDIQADVPYPLWKHPDNNVHKYYWKIVKSLNMLINLADKVDVTKDWPIEEYYRTARWFYDRGLHSCPSWWANPQRGTWSPNLIYKGIDLLMRSALNAQLALTHAGVETSEGYFDSISYYHGLLMMELYSVTKHHLKKTQF